MKILKTITILFFLAYANLGLAQTNPINSNPPCRPAADPSVTQYMIGYGSFMQNESKNKTYRYTGDNLPVIINGYRRGWFQMGIPSSFSTTFLGVVQDNTNQFNGVIFKLPVIAIAQFDKREMGYCREAVDPSHIKMLTHQALPKGQFWIYVTQPEKIACASIRYPITQSYVDVFLSGCLQIQKTYHLKNFTQECIDTTQDWSPAWVNDRIYPRRPTLYQPNAIEIDQILAEKMPAIFKQIKIE